MKNVFNSLLLLILFLPRAFAQTEAAAVPAAVPAAAVPVAVPAAVPAAATTEAQAPASGGVAPSEPDSGYEIDYEEEPDEMQADTDSEEEAPAPSKKKKTTTASKGKSGGGPAVQGSRAKNRFTAILKSDTKSVYKKNGKALDVDTD